LFFFFFSSRRRHTISKRDWSSDVCSSDLQTFDFNLTLGQKINLEIANINGEIYISNKPENSSKSINDQNIFNKKEFSNRFTRVQLENESYKDIKPITDDFN